MFCFLFKASNSNLISRQRSHTERRCLTKMMDDMESDDDQFMLADENKKKGW